MIVATSSAHMLHATRVACFAGLPSTVLTAGILWAGTVDFGLPETAWKVGLGYALFSALLPWLIYLVYRRTEMLQGNGFLALLGLSSLFSLFGFSTHFFYFGFAPMPRWASLFGVIGGAALMIHWGYKVWDDVMEALQKNGMFSKAYVDEGEAFYYSYDFMQKFEEVQKTRSPFKSYHLWFALALSPFVVILNRVLTPYTGSGHGVFMILSFLGLPMSLWIIGMAVRAYILMIHYPIKLQRQTGKPVLMRGFS